MWTTTVNGAITHVLRRMGFSNPVILSHVAWVTRDPRVAIAQLASTAWVQEPTLLKLTTNLI